MSTKSQTDANAQSPSGTIPTVSFAHQRAAAEERRQAYPYRFPRDRRQLGGKYSVAENARRLLRFFYFERRLMQALGAWTLSIPEFEVKLETGRHIFYHGDAARLLRERLNEQEMRLRDIDGFRDPEIDRFIEELLSAESAGELLVGMHQVIGRALAIQTPSLMCRQSAACGAFSAIMSRCSSGPRERSPRTLKAAWWNLNWQCGAGICSGYSRPSEG